MQATADPACDRRSSEKAASERGSILDTHLLDCAAHDFDGSGVAGDQLILPQSLLWDCPGRYPLPTVTKGEHMFRVPTGWRRLAALAAAGACVSTCAVVIGTSSAALADVCGTAANGTTSWSTNAPPPGGAPNWHPLRSVWTKRAPGCHDYNIVHANSGGNFAGFLQRSNGTWFECAAGYISVPGGVTGDWVECTNVATGTHMTSDTLQFPGGDGYRVNI